MRLVGVPVKTFGEAKSRLASVLGPAAREALGKRVASQTLATLARLPVAVAVVTGDDDVVTWAQRLGYQVLPEGPGGLDGAASSLVAAARGRPWAVLHADLPLLRAVDVEVALAAADEAGTALAPSSDGGTSLVAGAGPFAFSYGPGSFVRHLRSVPDAVVVVRRGLAVDLDTPSDLAAVGNGPVTPSVS